MKHYLIMYTCGVCIRPCGKADHGSMIPKFSAAAGGIYIRGHTDCDMDAKVHVRMSN